MQQGRTSCLEDGCSSKRSTYLENPPQAAPRRTTIAISLNEIKDTAESGGMVGKKVKRTKPKIHIVANSQADFAYVMKVL